MDLVDEPKDVVLSNADGCFLSVVYMLAHIWVDSEDRTDYWVVIYLAKHYTTPKWHLSDADVAVEKEHSMLATMRWYRLQFSIIEQFKIDERVKLNSPISMDHTFFEWFKCQLRSFKVCI